jgi:hypothetical protein
MSINSTTVKDHWVISCQLRFLFPKFENIRPESAVA